MFLFNPRDFKLNSKTHCSYCNVDRGELKTPHCIILNSFLLQRNSKICKIKKRKRVENYKILSNTMKKVFLFACGAALMFASCEKESVTPVVEATGYSFSSEINAAATRATTSNFETGDEIGVSAFSDELYTSALADNVLYTYNGSLFTSTTPISFTEGGEASFRAVYPFQDGIGTEFEFAIKEDQSVTGAYTLSDLMVAETEVTTSTEPTLSFNHRLTQINVSIVETNVSLTNAVVEVASQLTVDCDLTANTFEGIGEIASVVAAPNGTNYFTAIVAPGTLPSGTEFVTITVGDVEYSVVLSKDVELASGVSYTYEGTITAEGGFEFTSTINEWNEGGLIDLEEEEPGDEPEEGFVAVLSVTDITDVSAYCSWTVNDQTQNYLYGLFTGDYTSAYTADEFATAAASIISTNILAGDAGGTFTGLTAESAYTLCVFAIDADGTPIVGGAYYTAFTTAEAEEIEVTEAYDEWLGTWNLTSSSLSVSATPITIDVIITESATSGMYDIYGLDLTAMRYDYAVPATFNSTTEGWTIAGTNSGVGTYTNTDGTVCPVNYSAYAYIEPPYGAYYFITGTFDALTATMNADKESASVACYTGAITGGYAFTVATVLLNFTYSSSTYNWYSDTESFDVDQSDVLVGPFTLSKVSDSTTLPSSAKSTLPGPVDFTLTEAASISNGLNCTVSTIAL